VGETIAVNPQAAVMTTFTIARRDALRWHRPLLVLTGVMAALAVVTAAGIFLDPRVLTGAPIWVKPFKFAVSLGIYGLTIAWMLSVLPRRSRVGEWAAVVIVAVAVIEEAIIVLQAARGTTSHYNESSDLDAAVWYAMGGIVSLGSNVSTLRQTTDAIGAAEALRSDLIGRIDLLREGNHHDRLAVRRHVRKPVVEAVARDLFLIRAVGRHAPDLHEAAPR